MPHQHRTSSKVCQRQHSRQLLKRKYHSCLLWSLARNLKILLLLENAADPCRFEKTCSGFCWANVSHSSQQRQVLISAGWIPEPRKNTETVHWKKHAWLAGHLAYHSSHHLGQVLYSTPDFFLFLRSLLCCFFSTQEQKQACMKTNHINTLISTSTFKGVPNGS